MLRNQNVSPEIEALLGLLFREVAKRSPADAATLASAILVRVAKFLGDLGVEVEISNKR